MELQAFLICDLNINTKDKFTINVQMDKTYKLPNVLRGCITQFVNISDCIGYGTNTGYRLLPDQELKFFVCNDNVYFKDDMFYQITKDGKQILCSYEQIILVNPQFPKQENFFVTIKRKQIYNYKNNEYTNLLMESLKMDSDRIFKLNDMALNSNPQEFFKKFLSKMNK